MTDGTAPAGDIEKVELDRWPLRFRDQKIEQAFGADHAGSDRILQRRIAILAGVIILLYDLVFRALGEPNVNAFLIYRFSYVAWICVVIYLTFKPHWPRFAQGLLTLSVVLCAITMAAMMIVAGSQMSQLTFYASNILVMMFAGGFGMLRSGYALVAILGTMIVTVIGLYIIDTPTIALGGNAALLFTAALVATTSAYLLELSQRQAWLRQRTIISQRDTIFIERARADDLLRNVLPDPIADRLKKGERPIADGFLDVTVLFADVVQFTPMAMRIGPKRLVELLDDLFSAFDRAAEQNGIEKVKTVGDAYMAVCGAPDHVDDHAPRMFRFAQDVLKIARDTGKRHGEILEMRIGINSGPVVAGVIGRQRIIYDLWGDTVNVASRLEAVAPAGSITISDSVRQLIDKSLAGPPRRVDIKGKGEVVVYDTAG